MQGRLKQLVFRLVIEVALGPRLQGFGHFDTCAQHGLRHAPHVSLFELCVSAEVLGNHRAGDGSH